LCHERGLTQLGNEENYVLGNENQYIMLHSKENYTKKKMVPNSLVEKPEEMNLRPSKINGRFFTVDPIQVSNIKNGCEWDTAYNGFTALGNIWSVAAISNGS